MNKTEKTTFTVPSSAELEQLAELHKAMGDYTRMRILWYLMQKEYCVSDLAQKWKLQSPLSPISSGHCVLPDWHNHIKREKM